MPQKFLLFVIIASCILNIKTNAQTVQLVQDINSNGSSYSSTPQYLTAYNGKLYFQANDKEHGAELWVYDGSEAKMVEDFYPGSTSSTPSELYVANGKLYFDALKGGSHCLCVYDDSTDKITTIDFEGTYPSEFMLTEDGSTLYFSALCNSNSNKELWAYDFTNTPYIVDESWSNIMPYFITEYKNQIFFTGYSKSSGFELFKYSVGNIFLADDIIEGSNYSFPTELIVFNNQLMFAGNTLSYGLELLSYGPKTAYYSTPIANINAGTADANPHGMTIFDNQLYFWANDGTNGSELWMYDGTNTPSMIYDINPDSLSSETSDAVVFDNKLYFNATNGTDGNELWVYDGVNNPEMVADINPGSSSSSPTYLTVCNGKLYFQANDGEHGKELWSYDGNNSPTLICDIYSRTAGAGICNIYNYNDTLFFQANDGEHGAELWSYNGTSASLFLDINNGSGSSSVYNIRELKDTLYFMATNGSQYDLYKYDGTNTPQSTYDLYGGKRISKFYYPIVFDDQFYYNERREFYTFNGHSPQSNIPIISEVYSPDPYNLIVFDNQLYFIAHRQYNSVYSGFEIWNYDGINDPVIHDWDLSPEELVVFQNQLYFQGNDGTTGAEIWRYDGTNTPELVYDIVSGSSGSEPQNFYVFNNKLYFSATDGKNGEELWVYDGTNAPEMVFDINPSGSSSPDNFAEIDGELIFSANDGTNGVELWRYNGTNTPQLLKDICTGSSNSSPYSFCEMNNKLYFSATNYNNGNELWVYDPSATSNSILATVINKAQTPIANAQITINNTTYLTDTTGQVEIIDIENGVYTYSVSAENYNSTEDSVNIADADTALTIMLDSDSTYNITFSVNDGNNSIENAEIDINDTSYTTDSNGQVVINNIKNGIYNYLVSANNYEETTGTVTVDCSSISIEVTLKSTNTNAGIIETTNIQLYPNPVENKLYVNIGSNQQPILVKIYSISGTLYYENEISNNSQINVEDFSTGTYIVCIKDTEGYVIHSKILKK